MTDKTLYDKLWDMHLVKENVDGSSLLYICLLYTSDAADE